MTVLHLNRSTRLGAVLVAAASLSLAACSSTPSTSPPTTHKVTTTTYLLPPQVLTALSKDFTSPKIPPGGTFTWKSDTLISERYAVSNGFQGRIDVGAFPH